jgi:hypothetical protein
VNDLTVATVAQVEKNMLRMGAKPVGISDFLNEFVHRA